MSIKMFSTLKTLLLALCCAASLHAQVTSSSVSGTVLDAHGAVVPGAKVTLRNDAQSSSSRTLVASPLGTFTFTPVVTSTYTLVVEAPGFKKYEDRGIVVDPDARVDLSNITLEVGAVSETVQVEANAVQLQTQTAQRDTVVTSRMAVDLPIVDRSFMSLLQVVPGIVGASRYGGNINGNRNDSMSVKLDGMSNMDSGVNMCCSTWVNMDTIAEFKVITNNQSADIGHSGGASISVVSKSGTKQFHGSAYGFLRNESLNANTWMNNYNSVARPIYRYNTEGFTLGGPVWVPSKLAFLKNKLFFFASEEKQNSLTGTALHTNSVPTAAERGGDFSNARDGSNNLITIKDPLAGGAAFPGNLIPVNRFSHDGLALLNVMPMPNSSVNATYNYVSQNPYHQPELIGTYKFDYNISDRWRSYVRYTRDFYNSENPYGAGTFPGFATAYQHRKGMGIVLNISTIISPTLTNEFSTGASQNLIPQDLLNDQPYTRSALGLTYTSLYPTAALAGLGPSVSFGSLVPNAPSLGTNNPQFADNTNFNWLDNLAKVTSKHLFKFGVSIERDRKDQTNGNPVGTINFQQDASNPNDSGFGFSNALLGNFDTFSQANSQLVGKYRFTNVEWYVQDTWKVSKKLTIDAGIRFEILHPISDAKGQIATFNPALWNPAQAVRLYTRAINPATGKVAAYDPVGNVYLAPIFYGAEIPGSGNPLNGFAVGGQNGYPAGLAMNRGVQFGPRLGLAYQIAPKTVIRTGAGIYYDREQGNPWYFSLGIPPTTRIGTTYYGNLTDLQSIGQTFFPTTGGTGNGAGMSIDGHVPTVYNWNFGIQRELPFHTVVEAAYVANINRHLDNTQNINSVPFGSAWLPQNQDPSVTPKFDGTTTVNTNLYRPYPSLDRYQLAEWGGTANYNSLQFTANRRMARNLTFGVTYSFSKALGTADQIYNSGDIPGNVRAANYGRLAYDRTNSMVISYTYTLPRPIRGASFVNNFATRSLLNDWQVSGITSFVSGAPASVGYNVSGVTLSNVITGNPDYGPRPIIIGNSLSSDRNLMQWFNTAAFNPAIKGSTANDSGLNYLTLPGRNNTDLTIFKNVPFTGKEGRYIQFRLEGYNAFNHTQWSGVNTTATFASITSNVITNLPLGIAPGTSNGGRFGFGAANGTAGARIVQIALKVYF